jgi:uroporphyrinogen-III synthase
VLVTRPEPQAHTWVKQLRAQGFIAHATPLIAIKPSEHPEQVQQAWATLFKTKLVVFVSPNAVLHFFAAGPNGVLWPEAVWAASPGPGTTQALLEHGVPSACIIEPPADALQFDSESLWSELARHDWAGSQVLIVRASQGRQWLCDQLTGQGAQVFTVPAYRRALPALSTQAHHLLQQAWQMPHRHLLFFSSSEAIDNLTQLFPQAQWAGACALATHPRIAQRAQNLGITELYQAHPSLHSVVSCIQSIPF